MTPSPHGPDGHGPSGHGPNGHDKYSREFRLHEIRREAEQVNKRQIDRVREGIAPVVKPSPATGYYGMPLLKRPQWTWEIPAYFFVGGAAGSAAVLSACAHLAGENRDFIRDARWLAAIGGAISPALLISDLGVPTRFLNMLRVFKIQSAMSVGSWTLFAFSSSAAAAAFTAAIERNRTGFALRFITNAAEFVAAIAGLVLSTYTGVLIGATAVPVWNENIGLLPIHFAASGLASAVSILELRGHRTGALNSLGIAASGVETLIGAGIELNKRPAMEPLKKGRSGWLTRLGGLLSGPLPLALRILASGSSEQRSATFRRAAAVSSIAGSVATRYAWLAAGKISAQDPTIPLQLNSATESAAHQKPVTRTMSERSG